MTPLLETHDLSKSFSGQRVLRNIFFTVFPGEVHALMGENGAGKSTLMKVLAGVHEPDSGQVRLSGAAVSFRNTLAALKAGVAMIYQELLPFPDLSVAENILMGQEPARLGWLDKTALRARAADLLARLGVNVSPARKMRELSVAEMQAVEIAKALAHRARIIIMDEPSSALSDREVEALFRIVQDLRSSGVAVIYISHKLDEVFRVADRVTVLRDGNLVATEPAASLTPDRLIALMAGRELNLSAQAEPPPGGPVVLSVRNLCRAERLRNISFDLHAGEILGVAGLMGAGRTDLVNALYGLEPADSGELIVNEEPVRVRKPADALRAGIGLVSEDRKLFGLVPNLGVKANITLAALKKLCRGGFIDRTAENRAAEERIRALSIRVNNPNEPAYRLSGGNQQKAVLARMLLNEPRILLLDEPTRGIDVGAKAEVHSLIRRLAAEGNAVLLVSSEMPELLALSHRLLVLSRGRLTGELPARNTRPEEVLKLAMPA
jgi:inositol transport system ATP-binding protein